MTGWQISPEGINVTIENTRVSLTGMSVALGGLVEGVVQPVIDSAGDDGIVAGALGVFLQDQQDGRVKQIGQKAENTVSCTVAAVNAYIAGDEQMAGMSVAAAGQAQALSDETKF